MFLLAALSAGAPGASPDPPAASSSGANPRAELAATLSGLRDDLAALEKSHQAEAEAVERLLALSSALSVKVAEVAKVADSARRARSDAATDRLFAAVKEMQEMQEMQMSFNLQYLMLQNKISHENRQFSMVSKIMKSKHDTAKNSINNIR
jgi:phage-related baseplate assembly protein